MLAWDNESKKQVAVKIIRSGDLFLQQVVLFFWNNTQSKIEIQLYQLLQNKEDPDRRYIVQLLDISCDLQQFASFMTLVYVQGSPLPRV